MDQSRVQSSGERSTAQAEQDLISKIHVGGRSLPARIPRNPDDVMADARSRVGKLEATISVLDENNSTVFALKEALRQARSQTRRSAGRRGKGPYGGRFSARGGKTGWQRSSWKLSEFKRERIPPPHVPAEFAQELAELRACVAELQRERDVGARFTGWGRPGDPSAEDQVVGHPIPRPCDGAPSIRCRSIRSDGNSDQSVRCYIEDEQPFQSVGSWWFVNISSRYGLRGFRIGEASHPGPPRSQLRRASTVMDLTAMDRESEGDRRIRRAPRWNG